MQRKRLICQNFVLRENSEKRIRKLLGLDDPLDNEIAFQIQLISQGRYGVFIGTVLIAIHTDRATADEHCQRLRDQQAQE
jgi:hypothetical protein